MQMQSMKRCHSCKSWHVILPTFRHDKCVSLLTTSGYRVPTLGLNVLYSTRGGTSEDCHEGSQPSPELDEHGKTTDVISHF